MSDQEKDQLEDLLAVYNSITPSRTRWVRNRNELKNRWKELFQALETASGRDGVKVAIYDPEWHEVGDKGSGVTGAKNKTRKAKVEKRTEAKADDKKTEIKKGTKK